MIEFNNIQEFIDRIGTIVTNEYPNLIGLLSLKIAIHSGCRCSLEKRINAFNDFYRNLPNKITQPEKEFLKLCLGADKIVLKEGENIVWEIV